MRMYLYIFNVTYIAKDMGKPKKLYYYVLLSFSFLHISLIQVLKSLSRCITFLHRNFISRVARNVAIVIALSETKHQILHNMSQTDTSERNYIIPYPIRESYRDAIFFLSVFGQPRHYAPGHVLFYDCARNERGAREKIENEWVGGCVRISKTRNWPSTINHSSVGRSVGRLDSFRSGATLSALAA